MAMLPWNMISPMVWPSWGDRKSTRLNSSHLVISYAVFCLKKKNHAHVSAANPGLAKVLLLAPHGRCSPQLPHIAARYWHDLPVDLAKYLPRPFAHTYSVTL